MTHNQLSDEVLLLKVLSSMDDYWCSLPQNQAVLEALRSRLSPTHIERGVGADCVPMPTEPTVGMLRILGCTAPLGRLTSSAEYKMYKDLLATTPSPSPTRREVDMLRTVVFELNKNGGRISEETLTAAELVLGNPPPPKPAQEKKE